MIEKLTDYMQKTYHAKVERPWASYPDYITFKDVEVDKWFALIMPVSRKSLGGKALADGARPDQIIPVINVKADTEWIYQISQTPGYMPGYHMNKQHWLTIFLDGTVPYDQVLDCIDASYRMVTDTPTKRIYEAVKQIPKGKVATYGRVAELAGEPKMARAVGNALHKNPDPEHIPCHRVVNAKGELADAFVFGGVHEQAVRLTKEGVEIIPATEKKKARVDLEIYGY